MPAACARTSWGGTITTHGDVAQLAERLVRNEEVMGSTPIFSTRHHRTYAHVAQMEEHSPCKRDVPGSIPGVGSAT
jgi:hypothetical protein